ncbi:PQQ-like beta-propeller repeat protein [Streptomyces sp. NBC_00669]|uniref:outer membrane protein assembly factor BamB family protein n=1 Tax=Streptomyces sp. NBC_00669 TaxID=2976011 RepID=UPI002E3363EE|nr:PQQ-binding-like beta-propeller repeat protein [Streptomyces sp. NBC_00669]
MSQPPPPPGNPPPYGGAGGAVPPPPSQPDNPYASPPPPGQNPYAAPTQPAFPQQQPPPPPQPQQPRQPPQQPPPAPAPGYGYPGPQPPQPGQGYAQPGYGQQQYGQTPPPAGPYGYPQQAPAPQYGQQPPYGGQPPYGQPGIPGGGGSKNKLVIIVAAVVAAVLVIGGGVYFATKGGGKDDPKPQANSGGTSGGPSTAAHKSQLDFKWDKDADTVAEKDNLKDELGVWFTDKYVVKNQINQVVGYDIGTGAQAWAIPAAAGSDCTAARDAYHDMTAIQYGADCGKIMAIDLASGKMLWTAQLPGGDSSPSYRDAEMAVSGDSVGITWGEGSAGYQLSAQKTLWQSGDGDSGDNCRDDGYAGGAQFVAVLDCGYDTSYKVQVVDPANAGAAKWTWAAPEGLRVTAVVSTDPVVVLLGTQDTIYTDVASLVDGRLQSRVSLGTKKYRIDDDGIEVQSVHDVLVDKDTVYLTLAGDTAGEGKVLSGIVAFNLSDGKQKWVAKPADNYDITGIGFQDGKVLGYEAPSYDKPGKLVTLDPGDGTMTTYATLGSDAYNKLDSFGDERYMVWHDNVLYLASKTVYAGETGQKYLVVYG